MKKGKARRLLAAVLLLVAVLSVGCGKEREKEEAKGKEEGVYQIYYLDSSGLGLNACEYRTETTELEQLVGELAGQLLAAPADTEYQPVLPDRVQLLDITKSDNILYLNFSKDYDSMDPVREILCRAAFTKTLTQAEGKIGRAHV